MINSLDYFKLRLESTISPMDLAKAFKERPNDFYLVDVRIGSSKLLKEKIKGATVIPQNEIIERMSELPKEKEIWLILLGHMVQLGCKSCNPFAGKWIYG